MFLGIESYDIETPVNANVLEEYIHGYSDAEYIVNGFKSGFSLGIRDDYSLKYGTVKPRPSPMTLLKKLDDEVEKGRIIGPFTTKPMKDLFVSPLYVIPKPNSDKYRMIFNLSHPMQGSVNDNILENCRSVHYCSVQDVGQCLLAKYREGNAWLAKVDLADAYRIVPIQRSDWKFLGICIEDQYYIDRMLPMGASSSCQIFNRISDSLRWMFYKQTPVRAELFNYLDDFLFIADSEQNCEQALRCFENLCEKLGVPIAPHKTVRPVKSLVFLGIGIHAERLSMYIPQDKKQKMKDKLKKFLAVKAPQVKMWQSLAGSLNHIAQVIVCGKIYLSSIYESLSGILSQRQDKRRKISAEVRSDLNVWFMLLDCIPEKAFKIFSPSESTCMDISTDASSSVGYGCVLGNNWFAGRWPPGKKCNIAVLELYPIYMVLQLLRGSIMDTAVNVYTDNHALVSVLNKLYCRDPALRQLMRPITEICIEQNLLIVAKHISGEDNIGPDLLSRGMIHQFLEQFPHANRSPLSIPHTLEPHSNNLIRWN